MGAWGASGMHYSVKHGKVYQLVSERVIRVSLKDNRDHLLRLLCGDGPQPLCPCKAARIIHYCRGSNVA